MSEIRLVTLEPAHAGALEQLQNDCYPTLAPHERMREEHFLSHARLFPEGNFVALAGERVVGLESGFLTDFDLGRPDHTFKEIIAGGFYTNHDPLGAWYYGGDISVHPDSRGKRVDKRLYDARKALVQRLSRRGIVAGGLLPGYAAHKTHLSVQDYVARVVAGELTDPTLTFQLRNGFRVQGLLEGYLEDAASENWATLIIWENPEWVG